MFMIPFRKLHFFILTKFPVVVSIILQTSWIKTTQDHFSLVQHMNSASCCPSSRIQLPGQPFSEGLLIFRWKAQQCMGHASWLF